MITSQTIGEAVGALVSVPAGRTIDIAYSTTDLDSAIFTLERTKNRNIFDTLATFTGDGGANSGSVTVVNDTKTDWYVRAKAVEVTTFAGTVAVTFTQRAEIVGYLNDDKGNAVAEITDQGIRFLLPVDIDQTLNVDGAATVVGALGVTGAIDANVPSSEAVASGAAPVALDISVYESQITSGNTDTTENITIGDGTGAYVGQRKLITLVSRVGTDDVTLDDANFSQAADTITAIVLDADDEFILAEWQGASWEVIVASSGVVSVA
jgi:hypothetical protein